MKFIVSSSALLKQLQLINGVINSNTVLPILEDFLFEVNKNRLNVVATDLETVMKVELEVEANESGKVCIPARILVDSLKNLPDQPLTFSIDKNFAIEITSDNGKYKVMGENPDNFPKEPTADDAASFTIPSNALLTAINKTIFAVSSDDLRPAMTGVFFEMSKQGLQFVATDAHRLVRYKRKDVSCPKTDSMIVPKKPLNLLKSAIPANNDELTISYNNNHILSCILMAYLMGTTLGFLRYNFYPASIFMGDAGALFLGFVLGASTLVQDQKGVAVIALAVPMIVMAVPIVDTVLSFVRRLRRAREGKFFAPDRNHLHHRLLNLGLSQRQVVLSLYFFSICLGLLAFVLSVAPPQYRFLILLLAALWIAFGVLVLRYIESFAQR